MKYKTEQFAERLRSLRDRRGLNNLQLAKSVGLSHVSIGNFMNGQLPKSEHLVELAKFFGVTTDFLLGCDGKTPQVREVSKPLVKDALAELEDLKSKVAVLEKTLRLLRRDK